MLGFLPFRASQLHVGKIGNRHGNGNRNGNGWREPDLLLTLSTSTQSIQQGLWTTKTKRKRKIDTHLKSSVGLDRLLPVPRVIRIASDGLDGLLGSLSPASSSAEGDVAVLGDWDRSSSDGGTESICWASPSLVSNEGISFSNELKGCTPPLTVDMDEILEWHPECIVEDVYEERLL